MADHYDSSGQIKRNRNSPASEEPIDTSHLFALADRRHYGWAWSGPEASLAHSGAVEGPLPGCTCQIAPCGLVAVVQSDCTIHRVSRLAAAKQMHWARECPAKEGST